MTQWLSPIAFFLIVFEAKGLALIRDIDIVENGKYLGLQFSRDCAAREFSLSSSRPLCSI